LTCDDVTRRLTAYVDGELDDANGSAVRGHLRTCPACRTAADDELAVRDAMAKLPTPDVPPALWNSIQDQLAAREVADSKRSRWWLWWQAARPKLIPSALIAATAALAIVAYVRRDRGEPEQAARTEIAAPEAPKTPIHIAPAPSVDADCDLGAITAGARTVNAPDSAQIAGMTEAIDRCYEATVTELLALVDEDRPGWPSDRAAVFDAELDTARHAVTTARAGRPRERAWQAVIQLLQRAVTVQVVAGVTR
jgi:anti-sigma factor (TIGR02949 family)